MKILKIIIIIILSLVILPWIHYFFFAYKGLITSFSAKKELRGKLVYSIQTDSDIDVRTIDFLFGKAYKIYASIPIGNAGYHYVNSFSFSQDGRKIVLSRLSRTERRFQLYTMNIDGTAIKELLDMDTEDAKHPSWSPDCKRIAFTVQGAYGRGNLYVTNIEKPYSSLKAISDIRPATYNPTWSPDGQRISFLSDDRISKRISDRWRVERFIGKTFIINSDGTELRLFKGANEPVLWSPDGKFLLYRGDKGFYISNEYQSYTYLLIPYKRAPLSMLVEDPVMAVWSPDGKYIAYVKEIWPGGAGLGIFVVPIDNPKKEIQISAEWYGVNGMVWVK